MMRSFASIAALISHQIEALTASTAHGRDMDGLSDLCAC